VLSSVDKENRLQAVCFHDSPPLLVSPNGCSVFFLQNLVASMLGFLFPCCLQDAGSSLNWWEGEGKSE